MANARAIDDSNVQPIPIDEFLSRPVVLVDTYLRMPSGKFILIVKAGQATNDTSLEKFSSRKIDSLYVHVEDYQRFLVEMASALGANGAVLKPETQLALMKDAMTSVYREISEMGFTDQSYAQAKLLNHSLMTYVKSNIGLADLIKKFGQTANNGDVAHGMMVSMVAVMIGIFLDWEKPATLEKLSLGSFLHDLGNTKVPAEILNRQISTLNSGERIIFESHVEAGAQILSQSKLVPDDVLLIILEHHERADGSGYPKKLKDFQISPLARVAALANAFVDRIAQERRPLAPHDTLKIFQEFRLENAAYFNRDAMKALEKSLDPKKAEASKKRSA